MGHTLLYRLFKIGGIPKKLRPVLEAEGMVVVDEGIGGWVITKDVKGPGKRFKHRMEGFSGFLAITQKRIIAYTYWKRQINSSVEDPRISALHADLSSSQSIVLSFESSAFRDDWQGIIKLHFKTSKAQKFYDVSMDIGAQCSD